MYENALKLLRPELLMLVLSALELMEKERADMLTGWSTYSAIVALSKDGDSDA